jgi:tRNA (adenine37-N6)-methyltransferase
MPNSYLEMAGSLNLEPIGFARTASRFKFDAPSQPDAEAAKVNQIELLPGKQYELALSDLAGFDRIWLLWWFDRNQTWRPRVLPPRGPAKRRGVFATRSPHRPNPLGLTCVTLLGIEGRFLQVGPLDMTDGTPIFDIKPYLRTVDAHPESSLGWLEEVEAADQAPPQFQVRLSPQAERELGWLRTEFGIDFTERAFGILGRDPTPHRTRRILQIETNLFRIACGAWRMYFRILDSVVEIVEIEKGYADEGLQAEYSEKIIDRDAQIAFAAWKHRT